MRRNRILYGGLFLGVFLAALLYGDPFMFMTLYALIAMPLISLVFAVITLYGIGVTQDTKGTTVVKDVPNQYYITLHNHIKIGFGTLRCLFMGETFAVVTDASQRQVEIRPFMRPLRFPVDFTIKYRGVFQLGLNSLEILDMLGLFRIRRTLLTKFEVIAHPMVTDLENIPLTMHMLSKAPANLTIAQEDYEDYSDVRQYTPSDPIKKIHWKLTARRGEWMVKNYQSSVLNSMTILIDEKKRALSYESGIKLEDSMIEQAVSVLRFCLRQQMPVELIFGRNVKERGRHIGDFEALYSIMANLAFTETDFSVNDALGRYLNDINRNANVIIITSTLDIPLYERILNAVRFGHFIIVLYFVAPNTAEDRTSAMVYERLSGSGLNCVKI